MQCNALHPEPKDWETRVDADDPERGKALGQDIQQILRRENAPKKERLENLVGATANTAEIIAVFEG